ncbi:Rgp1p [Sugiyamaella lignohabitans]|uniref:Rgp1p n=1 Tax=Sugiyamaella lignohabitans TaxID=796027 RepID=A0A167CR35_9ASCO|nr:Rgp1p [Sugiyamaella lignohabitans]ANB12005.1 Rgp1p [Sugiyamaella lignohabitans]
MPSSRSNIRVEVTFKNPVVFAGESLNAIVTFRNISVGESGLEEGGSSGYRGNNGQQGGGHQRYKSTIDASLSQKPRPHRKLGRSADLSNGKDPILEADSDNNHLNGNGTKNGLETDREAVSGSAHGSDGVPTEASSGIDSSVDSPVRENSRAALADDDDDSSWLSGRRLSMQLANSFREFYNGGNNSSTAITRSSTGLGRSASTATRGGSKLTRSSTGAGGRSGINASGDNGAISYQSSLAASRNNLALAGSQGLPPVNLLMGFAQLQGYFQVDDTIVSAEVFEHVKTQGIVVGHNGLEYKSGRGDTGLLRGLTSGLGSFGGFGSFFKSDDNPNSNPTARHGVSNSGSGANNGPSDIPIFSTPQSLLFVDLKLAPGESKSFSYQLNIPKTLPPSCRAKAISIYYNLVIGTQKLSSRGTPEPKIILVPFRVFPFVDSSGNQPSHNLHDPIVLKKDEAVITQLNERRPSVKSFEALEQKQRSPNTNQDSPAFKKCKEDFTNYLDDLLTNTEPLSGDTSLSDIKLGQESSRLLRHRSSLPVVGGQEEYTARENIDFFIKYYQQIQAQQSQASPQLALEMPNSDSQFDPPSISPPQLQPQLAPELKTSSMPQLTSHKVSFDINLHGHRIAFIYLSRPIYRIGEDIILVFDFTSSVLNCHHITATLETTEKLGADISLKSPQEVVSITRRIFSHTAISTFASSRTCLQFTIPSTGTPQFSTSDISLGWSIRIDFITSSHRLPDDQQSLLKHASPPSASSTVLRAKSALASETFSCRIPIQVYPTNQDIRALLDHHSGMMSRRWVI